ncbi:MAG: dienelactone hydrolase family protein [Candidatus Limnocylindrales bacterium]
MAGGAADGRSLELVSADGTRFRAFSAAAQRAGGAGILIFPDVRGLHPYYEELALRFAESGIDALAIDYFGRTAGSGPRAADFEFTPHVAKTTFGSVMADARAGAAQLRRDGRIDSLFTVGFCFGGRLSFLAAADEQLSPAGVIGFYGPPVGPGRNDARAPLEVAERFRCPVLGLFGGADASIPPSAVEAFDAALSAARVDHELHVYPNAPHSFFDRKFEEFAGESADAWDRMRRFIATYSDEARAHQPDPPTG